MKKIQKNKPLSDRRFYATFKSPLTEIGRIRFREPLRRQDRAIVSEPEPHDRDRVSIRCEPCGLLPAAHLSGIKPVEDPCPIYSELFLKVLNEPLAFCFGGEETALQPPFHIPPRFILFDPIGPVVSFDFHLTLNLPE